MTDRPALFSDPMVRALLEGRKTQTRRPLKPPHKARKDGFVDLKDYNKTCEGALWWWDGVHSRVGYSQSLPYAVGDRIWVRETFRLSTLDDCIHYDVCDCRSGQPLYRADPGASEWSEGIPWKPSIHMPRWASRLTLIVTDVRVQRVQDISEEDATAEGCAQTGGLVSGPMEPAEYDGITAAEDFRDLWNTLYGPDAWDANPWVVALTFDVHKRNIDAMRNYPE